MAITFTFTRLVWKLFIYYIVIKSSSCVECATVQLPFLVMQACPSSVVDQDQMTTHPQHIYQSPHCVQHDHSLTQRLSKTFVLCSQRELEK